MPRPPRHVRDALKQAGEWDFQPSPPPFDPIAAFCAGSEDLTPMPGAFDAHLDFSSPPPATFLNGPLFGDMHEVVEDAFVHELPGAGVFQTMALDGEMVADRIFAMAHIAAACNMTKAHETVGAGVSRLSGFCNQPVPLPEVINQYVSGIGELLGPDDRQWLYADFDSEIRAAVRASVNLLAGYGRQEVKDNYWLPTQVDDDRARLFLAFEIHKYLRDRGVTISVPELDSGVFLGTIPPALSAIAHTLPKDEVLSLTEFFKPFSSDREFLSRFSAPRGQRALALLGISWDDPSLTDLAFKLDTVSHVRSLIHYWQSTWQTYSAALGVKFQSSCTFCSGESSQFVRVTPSPGGCRLETYYSPSPSSASYRAVLGTSVWYMDVPFRTTAVGRIQSRELLVSLVRSHVGA